VNGQLFLLPPQGSAYAGRVDVLFWTMTAATGAVAGAIFVLLILFCSRYRRRSGPERVMSATAVGRSRNRPLEITWITLPLLVFLAFFFWAAWLYDHQQTPPAGAAEIYVVARQWMWKLEHPDGRREIDELHLPRGQPVRLVMTSQDVIHSFYVPELRIKQDVLPGRFTVLWFTPARSGVYHLYCAEYCGTSHSRMHGRIVVMEPQDYARWLGGGGNGGTLAQQGAAKLRTLGCSGCHSPGATIRAPSLDNLYGRTIPLADGSFVTVDEHYLRDSILLPSKQIAAGYADNMPSFAGQVSEQDLLELVEYVKSRAGSNTP